MSFLKVLLWVTVIVGMAIFAVNNWTPVAVTLWGGLSLHTKLPALVIAAFVIGFLPLYLLHRTQGWRMRRRINALESANRATTPPVFTPPPENSPLGTGI